MYVYLYSLHVSCNYVPIIRRINCISATPGICHSVWMTVSYVGWNSNLHTRQYLTTNYAENFCACWELNPGCLAHRQPLY